MKKHGFTILELLIVMIVIGIMITMARNLFSSNNKIYYQGETCINNVYSYIRAMPQSLLLSNTTPMVGASGVSDALSTVQPNWYALIFTTPGVYVGSAFPSIFFNGTGIDINAVGLTSIPPYPTAWSTSYLGTTVTQENFITSMIFGRGTGTFSVAQRQGMYSGVIPPYTFVTTQLPLFGTTFSGTKNNIPDMKGCRGNDFFVTTRNSKNTPFLLVDRSTTNTNALSMEISYAKKPRIYTTYQPVLTGALIFDVCNAKIQCKETHRIFFDKRVNDVFLQKCNTYGSNALTCTSWQGGDIN